MPCSDSKPAAPIAAAHEALAHFAYPSPWRLSPATPADVPAPAALYVSCAHILGSGCYTLEKVAVWASSGAVLGGLADHVVKADTLVPMAAVGLGIAPHQGLQTGVPPLDFSGIDDGGEVKFLCVRPDKMRRGLAGQFLALGLGRAQAHCIEGFADRATNFSLKVFLRAGLALVNRVRAEFAGGCLSGFAWRRDEAASRDATVAWLTSTVEMNSAVPGAQESGFSANAMVGRGWR